MLQIPITGIVGLHQYSSDGAVVARVWLDQQKQADSEVDGQF